MDLPRPVLLSDQNDGRSRAGSRDGVQSFRRNTIGEQALHNRMTRGIISHTVNQPCGPAKTP